REHEAVERLHDAGRAPLRDHAHRLGVGGLVAVAVDQPALRLADDLARDDHDVAIAQVWLAAGDDRGQVSAVRDLADPRDSPDLDARSDVVHRRTSAASSSAAVAMAVVASMSVISNGTARADQPSAT